MITALALNDMYIQFMGPLKLHFTLYYNKKNYNYKALQELFYLKQCRSKTYLGAHITTQYWMDKGSSNNRSCDMLLIFFKLLMTANFNSNIMVSLLLVDVHTTLHWYGNAYYKCA